ncbi:hypothetical protein F5B19DRAFT_450913 [Rostrohypoxylon terebratum]|nr:hypothetical protein F5B19DRAFT_450913 [Rostrohypoxylon terebratum]
MFDITLMITFGGRRALSHTPPKGTHSRIIGIHLHQNSRVAILNNSSCRTFYASPVSKASVDPAHAMNIISSEEFGLFRRFLDLNAKQRPGMTGPSIEKLSSTDPAEQFARPLRNILLALRLGDPRRLLIHLRSIFKISQPELQEALATLPRTTFTEILYQLDPHRICNEIDPTDGANISHGMFQILGMGSYVDYWGIRKIYVDILECLNYLVVALKATGQALHAEEHLCLIRCAGATSDPDAARWVWNDMRTSTMGFLRQTEIFSEYMSARFLTIPLYNSYDKSRRVLHPRDLHKNRTSFYFKNVWRLDRLRQNVRMKNMYFGLNKRENQAKDLRRKMRNMNIVARIYLFAITKGKTRQENLLYNSMIAFGRVGCLRYIGSFILRRNFGIHLGRLVFEERSFAPSDDITSVPAHLRPSHKLMRAIVDAYGSNGAIDVAYQLIDYISKKEKLKIPQSVWHDLLEWTYVLSSRPISTMWKIVMWDFKVPHPSAVELLFRAMVEDGVEPRFEAYVLLIKSILARNQLSRIFPFMPKLVEYYDDICERYDDAAIEYAHMVQDGVFIKEIMRRYERTRFLKAKIWHDIRWICHNFLSRVRSHRLDNPLTTITVPNFVHEFNKFVPNPIKYRTSTGYVELFDPAGEKQHQTAIVHHIPMKIPRADRAQTELIIQTKRAELLHNHSLLGHLPITKLGLYTFLKSTSRARIRRRPSPKVIR